MRHALACSTAFAFVAAISVAPLPTLAQGTEADYERSAQIDGRFDGLAVDVMEAPRWIADSDRFWYRKTVRGGNAFVLVDPAAGTKEPAFDHARLAAGLSRAAGTAYGAATPPFGEFSYEDGGGSIEFVATASQWRCTLADYQCVRTGPAPEGRFGGRGGRGGDANLPPTDTWSEFDLLMDNPGEAPWDDGWDGGADVLAVLEQQQGGRGGRPSETSRTSPDGRFEAYIRNHNVWVRDAGEEAGRPLSLDGSEGNFYTLQSLAWSPDSRKLVGYRVIPGYPREVHYVISSPTDQLQPRDSVRFYRKPGDVLDRRQPVLFDVESRSATVIDDALFPNAYNMTPAEWWDDGRAFTFEYNQRGHQVYRVIEVDARTGAARALIDEQAEPNSFIHYSGGQFRHDVGDGEEIVWMSERDGWQHLYLYDGRTGRVKNRITKGEWVVRDVERVDEENRQIWFTAGGMNPDQDPYFVHYYRIDFDGTGLVALTEADGDHDVSFSPGGDYYVDRWSRVDLAPVGELRRTSDRSLVLRLEEGDVSGLVEEGWTTPEVFVAKGRDGVTDIWGMVIRPTNFDPSRKYPVIEYIYAGPHGFHTPKSFSVDSGMRSLAELGFILVQMDGMGTAGRSRAFHDVAWKNLGDAGFPDRILWHRALAEKYPWYDVSRVGIYGGSAGGQNAMGALLFHPDFYDVAVSFAGCHDNRMDKIWWNEQWMGWPLDRSYVRSSNMEQAHRLQGELLLVVGELDTNVDPASTVQVVNALIEAGKDFDFLLVPGANHGNGGDYGVR
ncbi:MAG TPA: DPP IV N-terminal domain-containing protein, partial [Candidatus Thermoplasmatota archaeon]